MVNHEQYRSQPGRGKVITTPFEDVVVEEGAIRRTESNRSELLCSATCSVGGEQSRTNREDDRDGTN